MDSGSGAQSSCQSVTSSIPWDHYSGQYCLMSSLTLMLGQSALSASLPTPQFDRWECGRWEQLIRWRTSVFNGPSAGWRRGMTLISRRSTTANALSCFWRGIILFNIRGWRMAVWKRLCKRAGGPRDPVDKVNMSQGCALAAEAAIGMPGCISNAAASGLREVILPLSSVLVGLNQESCVQLWAPQLQKNVHQVEQVQQRISKMSGGVGASEVQRKAEQAGCV